MSKDALKMTNDEFCFLENFRQTDGAPFPMYLAKERWSPNTTSSLKRKGWIEIHHETYHITELGWAVFHAASSQFSYDTLVRKL